MDCVCKPLSRKSPSCLYHLQSPGDIQRENVWLQSTMFTQVSTYLRSNSFLNEHPRKANIKVCLCREIPQRNQTNIPPNGMPQSLEDRYMA